MRSPLTIAGLGAALVLAGLAFASPSLVLPGLALAGLALLAPLGVAFAARGARVVVPPGPSRIVEGDSYPLRIELRRGRVPPPGGSVSAPLLGRTVPVGPFRPRTVELEVRMPRRGRHLVGGGEWTIRDPLGLAERVVRAPSSRELLVLPRVEPVRASALGIGGAGAGAGGEGDDVASSLREARAVEFEVDGLRPYREGSPASRIHWPAVARTGEMFERRMTAAAEATPLVVLDAERPFGADDLDRAVRAAASLCVHLAPRSGCALLLPGHRAATTLDARLRPWPRLHAALAVVAGGTPTLAAASSAGAAGSVFWVTAGPPEHAARRLRRFGPGPHYVVTPRPPASARIAFGVAGCAGTAVGAAPRRARAA